jgi:hypothetical protein
MKGWEEARVFGAAAAAVYLAIGCVPPGTTTGAGGEGGAGGAVGSTTTSVLEGTDAQVCALGCQKLIECGAELDLDGCKQSCTSLGGGQVVSCFRGATLDCNPLASCALGAVCGSGGTPSGTASCGQAATCAVNCAGQQSGTCGCSCSGQAAPTVASDFYGVTTCSALHCSNECAAVGGDPSSCQTCLATSCAKAASHCKY